MQSLGWYIHRLGAMGLREMLWRVRAGGRNLADRVRHPVIRRRGVGRAVMGQMTEREPFFRVCPMGPGACLHREGARDEREWYEQLLTRANAIAENRLTFFGVERDLGHPIDWNRDAETGRRAPMWFAPAVDYRDAKVAGDCKLVWEPNRHQHLVVLARAWRASGEAKYAQAAARQLESWLDACPFGLGMNWRSGLELGVRLINWVVALDLLRESGVIAGRLRERLIESAYLHLWELTRKYSRGSSANNHLIGEAAGVFIGASYFDGFARSRRWRDDARTILSAEIFRQTYGDGGTREQAFGYELFVIEFFLLAAVVAERTGCPFGRAYHDRLAAMLSFIAAVSMGDDHVPMVGDADDGYVLDLGDDGPRQLRSLLGLGAILYGRGDCKAWSGGFSEPAAWLLGPEARRRYDDIAADTEAARPKSQAFEDSGYYLLEHAGDGPEDRISVLFDCGELGFGSTAAHGHADALSFVLRAFGQDILVDPGTYDYFTHPEWRNWFRSTAAHNTVRIDGRDQSQMLGPFLWGRRARARRVEWLPQHDGGSVMGEHDGYTYLAHPVVHRRNVTLDGPQRTVLVRDRILGRGRHRVELNFHLAETCRVTAIEDHDVRGECPGGTLFMRVDPRLSIRCLSGSEEPMGGWVSRAYHERRPGTTVTAAGECADETLLETRIVLGRPKWPI